MTTPLVSVGIPTYNRPIGLKKTIICFLNQSYSNIEIIISDNCSENPDVKSLCEKFSAKDDRIRYYRQSENIGMYGNFRFVLEKAKGDFFSWASDDDIFHEDFVKKCLKPFNEFNKMVLCSPFCQVLKENTNLELYDADFHTIGLNQIDRIKKIAFYIKRRHSAFYGLYKTEELRKIKVYDYLDCDGLILIQLATFGEFYQQEDKLMVSTYDYNENNTKSLTFQKEKLIDTYKMRPKFFLMNYEKLTMLVFTLKALFKTKKLSVFKIINLIPSIYTSIFGYDSIYIIKNIKKINFLFKKKKLIAYYSLTENLSNDINKIKFSLKYFDAIIISIKNIKAIENEELKKILKNEKITCYHKNWKNKISEMNYSLSYINDQFINFSHIFLLNQISIKQENIIRKVKKEITKIKKFHKCLSFNNIVIVFPNKKYIYFKTVKELSVKGYELNFD